MPLNPEERERELASVKRLHAEYRRVGVSHAEIDAQLKREVGEYLSTHPEVRSRVEADPNYDPSSISMAFNCQIALEVLAALPDRAGTAIYLQRLRELQRARGWDLFARPDA